ncbi:MAG: ASCH domain-containing protein [Planktothrix sp. GU0601_MAG3]|nr:MAG: ASCH domain-containing protein [Planktothrix sp. GU0601_MAG3]
MLLSIKPEYAKKILAGKKTVELRRVRTRLEAGDLVLVYVTSPQQNLVASLEVERVITENLPQNKKDFWEKVKDKAGITYQDFQRYYQGASLGVAIFFNNKNIFNNPIKLTTLKKKLPTINPPQSYRYITDNEFKVISKLAEKPL